MPIEIKELSFSYDSKPFIDNLDLKIDDGEMVGIIGNTGCGKSTFVRLIAGLIKSDNGKIIIDGDDITNKKFNKKILRRKLGIVFQFPEMQLFEQTIEKDIFFGLKQYKLTYDEKYKRAKEALELLGLDFERIKDKSPLALSGGEKRKIAVAGILVCKPKYLIFDEPIAGLDCNSRDNFMKLLLALKQNGTTIIIISHNTDYLAEYADRILVMDGGKIILDDKPNEIFNQTNLLNNLNIGVCNSKEIANLLNKKGFNIQNDILKYDDLLNSIISNIGVIND
jgi:energy-coupling factor transport system ATP-binding protein